jgi:hypothetical protein
MSKIPACALAIAILFASCSDGDGSDTVAGAAAPPAADVAALATKVGDAVWRVDTEGCGWLGSGSAFAIDRRHLVTNHHVTANDTSPVVRSREGKRLQGRVIGATKHPDVAVIEVPEDLPTTITWAPTPSLVERETVVVFGYPRPEKAFRANAGSIVSFAGGREAALADAPVERGNSGGPAVRADASVAGVVTRMSLPSNSADRVAVIFTADAVRAAVDGFLRSPATVLSDCGLGPDYVPPVPKHYAITAVPPPPAQPAASIDVPRPPETEPPVVAVPTSAPRRASEATTSTVPCPSGRPAVRVDQMSASETDEPGWWAVRVDGTITNDTSGYITFDAVDVTISGEPPREAKGFPDERTLAPGARTAWRADDFVYSPRAKPTRATTEFSWSWSESRLSGCPSD